MTHESQKWPAWHYGPNGESGVFNNLDEVPEGWADTPGHASTPEGKKSVLDDFGVTRDEALAALTKAGVKLRKNVSDQVIVDALMELSGDDSK